MKTPLYKKTWFIHGTICLVMGIVCCMDFRCIVLWNLVYALYFSGKIMILGIRSVKGRVPRAVLLPFLISGAIFCATVLCIPSVLLCRIHSLRNPEYARNLPVYESGSIRLANAAYYRDCNHHYFEGDIPEEELKKTAFLQNWRLREITGEIILTYTAVTRIDFHKNNACPDTKIRIRSGLFYNDHNPDGSGISVLYDREKKRLYVHRSFR